VGCSYSWLLIQPLQVQLQCQPAIRQKYSLNDSTAFINKDNYNIVCLLIKFNATVASWLSAGTAWLTTKCYKVFLIWVKYPFRFNV
jgi:hypothetical protein